MSKLLLFECPLYFQKPFLVPCSTLAYCIFFGSDWCLLDPVLEEERNAQGHIWFSITDDGKIVQFQHSGKGLVLECMGKPQFLGASVQYMLL